MPSFLKSLLGIGDKTVRERRTTDHKSGKTKVSRQTTVKYGGPCDSNRTRTKRESWEEGFIGKKNHKVHSDKTHYHQNGNDGRRKGGRRHKRR